MGVVCNHCGAPLEIGEATRFTTCAHCGSRLAVHHTGSARFTELVEEVADGLETIRLQNELERVDREWAMEQERLAIQNNDGVRQPPSAGGSLIALVLGGAFVCFWIVMATKIGAPWFFVVFGLVMLGTLVFNFVRNVSNAGQLDLKQRAYEARRTALVRRVEQANARTRRSPAN